MDCEVLWPVGNVAKRGEAILHAMIEAAPAAGVRCIVTQSWQRKAKVLMSYGLGHPIRRPWTLAHLAKGGRVIGWDLGYWDRESAMRLTIDQDHPQEHLRNLPATRWNATGFKLREDANPDGPIVLAGLGYKTRQLMGIHGMAWEVKTLARIRAAYPGREVVFRAKRPEVLKGVRNVSGTIEETLAGAFLVVCCHSNVAIDACIAGVPVVCSDGAAAALYGNNLSAPVNPTRSQRLRFLRNLAWWQWKPEEAADAWKHLKASL